MKDAILSYLNEFGFEEGLTAAQWRLMEKVIKCLEIFKEATLQISESDSLLSEVLPTGKAIRKAIAAACESDDHGVRAFKEQLIESLDRRFEEHRNEEKLLLATAVDSR